MVTASGETRKPVLSPIDRLSEILFGLIMALTVTGSLSVATADHKDVKLMLVAALGCNIAWGIIDAFMYLMASLNERGVGVRRALAVRHARSHAEAHRAIRTGLPRIIAEELDHDTLERIRTRVSGLRLNGGKPSLTRGDLRGALGVFMTVVAATLPVVLPFLFMSGVEAAMRLSNAVAVAMLALIGFFYGRQSGLSPWLTALAMVLIGGVLVALTIALGG